MAASGSASGPHTLPAALREAAARFGDHAAYVEATADGSSRSLSFQGLLEEVRAVARGALHRNTAARKKSQAARLAATEQ